MRIAGQPNLADIYLCGYEHPAYNFCCNRHCPQCQSPNKARWLEARNAELLPVTYFHNVLTLPDELNPWIRYNKKIIYDILFQSVSQSLLEFGSNLEKLSAKVADKGIVITESRKFGKKALVKFAEITDVDAIITDNRLKAIDHELLTRHRIGLYVV